jgi:hypothetical protein
LHVVFGFSIRGAAGMSDGCAESGGRLPHM